MLTPNLTNKKAKELTNNDRIEVDALCTLIEDRDSQLDNPFSKDAQVNYIRIARGFLGDKIVRTAPPHRLLDASKGPTYRRASQGAHPQNARRHRLLG